MNLQHPDLVSFFVSTGAYVRLDTEKNARSFCYKDPHDQRFYMLNGHEDLENLLTDELTPEFIRSGNKFTLFFEQTDWLYLPKHKLDLLSSLSAVPDITLEVMIVDDEPNDEYLICYTTKGRQSTID